MGEFAFEDRRSLRITQTSESIDDLDPFTLARRGVIFTQERQHRVRRASIADRGQSLKQRDLRLPSQGGQEARESRVEAKTPKATRRPRAKIEVLVREKSGCQGSTLDNPKERASSDSCASNGVIGRS